jgi:GPI ethanolamine phosphate transferase 3 subunit O
MGDDTWMSVFPDQISPNMSFPYDSFLVEDLHTVDEGVIKHLFPLLDTPDEWDLLIGHFLGVDHVGHRLGPDHSSMRAKLTQMNDVLARVVEKMDEDTLLVVLGDHGMDAAGDHGGDGVLETSAGTWIFSKGAPFSSPVASSAIPEALLSTAVFPGTTVPHRHIQQIDILPTMSLLLGLPIPFNSLGTIIPEAFASGKRLQQALEINSKQLHQYMQTYRNSVSGGDLDDHWDRLQSLWDSASYSSQSPSEQLEALYNYNRLALDVCRSMWAQFNVTLMAFGLILLVTAAVSTWGIYHNLASSGEKWEDWIADKLMWGMRGAAGGAIMAVTLYMGLSKRAWLQGVDALDCVLFAASTSSAIGMLGSVSPKSDVSARILEALPLAIHAFSFFSNSFILREDGVVLFLLISSIVPNILIGLTAPTSRLRKRILGFSVLYAASVRLASWSRVCREEHGPSCHVTFFSGASLPIAPTLVVITVVPSAIGLLWGTRRFLKTSKSDNGVATFLFPYVFTPALLLGTAFWLLEHAETKEVLGAENTPLLRSLRTGISRCAFGVVLGGGTSLWWALPMTMKISAGQELNSGGKEEKQVTLLGFGNAYGAPFLLFWLLGLSTLWVLTQLTGQLVLALSVIALLAHTEVVDSIRDVRGLQSAFASSKPSIALNLEAHMQGPWADIHFADIAPLALLGMHVFFGTGHQATIPSIQWKSGFVLSSGVVYPWSPLTLILNSFGGQLLFALAPPLLAMWNVAPVTPSISSSSSTSSSSTSSNKSVAEEGMSAPQPHVRIQRETLRATLAYGLYYTLLLIGALASAGLLRRHLMVWKVWAPRVGVALGSWIVVALAGLLAWAVGVARVTGDHDKGVNRILARLKV